MKVISQSIKLLGAVIVSLALLSGFVMIYSFTGTHVRNQSGATDYKWPSSQYKSNMVEGFSWLNMDDDGFNNIDISNSESPDILMMGSSHLEAINVAKTENMAYVLSELLPEYRIYNIGTSGHYIYQCAKNLRNAVDFYSPEQYVVVETATVSLDNERMQKVIDGNLPSIKSYDSGLLFLVQKYCPAIKSLYKCITDWRSAEQVITEESNNMDPMLLDEFIKFMSESVGNEKLIILYHPSSSLDSNGQLILQTSEADLKAFQSACEKYDVDFIDTSEQVYTLYTQQHQFIHGFSNTAVGVGHLNKLGHLLLADQLAVRIMEGVN